MSQRLANTRSGDLAEGMGIEMLRSIALIAPVPRPEDVGVDAFATLLKPRERHALPAAPETFAVQIKSWHTKPFSIDSNRRKFLLEMRLPLVFVRVDRYIPRVALFSSNELLNYLLRNDSETIVSFDSSSSGFILNELVAEWTTKDQHKESWHEHMYDCMLKHLTRLTKAAEERLIGATLSFSGDLVSYGANTQIMDKRLETLFQRLKVATVEQIIDNPQSEISYVLEDLLRAMINIGIADRSEIKNLEPLRAGEHILPQGFFEVIRENRIALTPQISFRSKSKLE